MTQSRPITEKDLQRALETLDEAKNQNLYVKPLKADKTAKKIDQLLSIGKVFALIGLVPIIIATTVLSLPVITVWAAETLVGFGTITLVVGAVFLTKAYLTHKEVNKPQNPIDHGLIGIKNSNLNCWLNSLMQMLLNCPEIRETLSKDSDFKEFIESYEKGVKKNKTQNSTALRENLEKIIPDIGNDSQALKDLEEPLEFILDKIRADTKSLQIKKTTRNHYEHTDGNKSCTSMPLDDTGILQLPLDTSKDVLDLNEMIRNTCFDKKTNDDPSNVTTIIEKETLDNSTWWNSFTGKKIITTEEVICGQKTRQLEEQIYDKAPQELFLHLKRFETKQVLDKDGNLLKDKNGNLEFATRKISDSVHCPLKLTLPQEHFEDEKEAKYELKSFANHLGNHYISYVKRDGYWFKCDDSTVSQVTEEKAQKAAKKAYLLNYRKL